MIKSVQTTYCTTREAAALLGVSLRTAQLWAESGLIEAWKTGGGHRRISRSSVQRLLDGEIARPGLMPDTPSRARMARIKLLVIEDDNILLKLYRSVIAGWNLPIDLVTAGNGIEGLIHIGRESPDLLIIDLNMPGFDGFQLIRSLVDSSLREGMEIAVVTGLESETIAARGGLPVGVRVFGKPVPFPELRSLLVRLLEQRAAYL